MPRPAAKAAAASTSGTKPKFVLKRQSLAANAAPKPKRARLAPEPNLKAKPSPKAEAKRPSFADKGKQRAESARVRKPALDVSAAPEKALRSKSKKTRREPKPSTLPTAFKIVAGSYEKLLYGLQGTVTLVPSDAAAGSSTHSGVAFHLKPQFIFPAHVSCVKAVAASPNGGKWLATGSADEIVKVWDLRRRKEIGGLMHHAGSVTHLSFPSRTHLLSASEDGTLAIFRARDWSVLRALRGHKGRVNAVAVHPSGKLALSVGHDRTLRMWDLMRGRGSASVKLYKEGEVVRWNSSGSMFVVAAQSTLDIYSTEMSLLHTLNHSSRIHDVLFVQHPSDPSATILLVGAENKKVAAYSIPTPSPSAAEDPESLEGAEDKDVDSETPPTAETPKVFAEFIGHANRVKALATLAIALPTSPAQMRTSTTILSTISSDGKVFVYDLFALPPLPSGSATNGADGAVPQLAPDAEYDSAGTRLTCVTLAEDEVPAAAATAGGKRKRVEVEDESSAEDEESEEDGVEWEDGLEGEEEHELEGEEEEDED